MSDYSNDRPAKRRRRDSSPQPTAERSRDEHRRDWKHDRPSRREDRSRSWSRERSKKTDQDDVQTLASPRRKHDDRSRHDRHRERSRERHRRRDSRDRDRSISPRRDRDRHTRQSRDHSQDRERRRPTRDHRDRRSRSPKPFERSKAPLPSQNEVFSSTTNPDSALDKPLEKQKPNFGLTGKLAAASNTIQTANRTIVLKYHEPSEARKPPAKDQWRMYVFKGEDILDTVELSEQSCWLMGREVAVADLPMEHPSCSKQHAVIQFRYLEKRNEFGDKIGKVKPYVLDLESANGTFLNDDRIPAAKYVELRNKDMLKFGQSTREYVVQLPK